MSGDDKPEPRPWGTPQSGGRQGPGDRQTGQSPSGGRGPFDPRGRPARGPRDFDDLQQRLSDFVRRRFGGPDGELPPRRWLPYAGGVFALLFLLSGLIVVGAREVAIVTSFGAWTRSYGPGLGYYLPLVERAQKVNITSLQKTEIDAATGSGNNLMLTGDENIVDLSFSVTWRVSDPGNYLFNVAEPRETIAAVAESAMREVIGRSALDSIISRGRSQIQIEVVELMQRVLDGYRAGIFIDGVQISEAGPPKEVINAFRDINNASQNAVSYANQARGQAARIRQQALGYRAQVVREAAGEAARFNQVYEQYKLAPGVTRDRLYIETMQRVLSKSNKVIIDGKGITAPVVLSPDVFKPRTAVPGATAEPAVDPQGDNQ